VRHPAVPVWLMLLSGAIAVWAGAGPIQGHDVLRSIRSPLDLARSCLPGRYRAAVTLTGSIADEMNASLAAQGLEPPRFEEVMERPGVFALELANESYSLDTRELVSGILNPAEFIDVVLRSIVRYRDASMFERVVKETRATVEPAPQAGPAALCVRLRPLGERFGYSYEDIGSHVRESWLTALDAVMDTTDFLVHALTLQRCLREYDIEQTSPPPVQTVNARYEFAYATVGEHILPSELHLFLNDSLVVTITASYRREGRHVVFDKRLVCNQAQADVRSCLEMRYGTYQFGAGQARRRPGQARSDATRDIQKAAELSRKAAAELRTGAIGAAFRLLERLVREYPDTPQGLEARKLLEGVPKGL
jgi:hypothetical protein